MPGAKKIAARMERRIVKQLLKPWRYRYYMTAEADCFGCECEIFGEVCNYIQTDIEPVLPLRHDIMDPYDICDWKWLSENPKYARK